MDAETLPTHHRSPVLAAAITRFLECDEQGHRFTFFGLATRPGAFTPERADEGLHRRHLQLQRAQQELEQEQPQSGAGSARPPRFEYVTGRSLRPRFLKTVSDARRNIIILLGHGLDHTAVSDELVNVLAERAQQGVLTLLGWGTPSVAGAPSGRSVAGAPSACNAPSATGGSPDARPPTVPDPRQLTLESRLLTKLERVRTPQGLPAARLVWLGNVGNKEVTVDGVAAVVGSQNLLASRGDYQLEGEAAHFLRDPSAVTPLLNAQTEMFLPRLSDTWDAYVADPSFVVGRDTALLGWAVLRCEHRALERLALPLHDPPSRVAPGHEASTSTPAPPETTTRSGPVSRSDGSSEATRWKSAGKKSKGYCMRRATETGTLSKASY